jgi:transcriptional regulator with XRE-family HTH domain
MTQRGARGGRGRPPNETRRRKVAELRARGWTLQRIAGYLGVTYQNVQHLFKARGVRVPERPVCCRQCGALIVPWRRGMAPQVSAWCLTCLRQHPKAPFGERLKALRLAAGLSQLDLARQTGVGRTPVGRFEAGRGRQTWPVLVALIDRLGLALVDVDNVLTPGRSQSHAREQG